MRRVPTFAFAVVGTAAIVTAVWLVMRGAPGTEPNDSDQIALGAEIYAAHCAVCHGAELQGQADWRKRLPSGRLPAPPHDETGHTWHHSDQQLFGMTKYGMTPYAPEGYESDMPAFEEVLSDQEIWAVLAYIKSTWPEGIRERQRAISERAD